MLGVLRRFLQTCAYAAVQRPNYAEPYGSAAYRRDKAAEYKSFLEEAKDKEHRLHPQPNMDYTGAGVGDYYLLYSYIAKESPATILELGSGITTSVMAKALAHVEEKTLRRGRLVTVDHIQSYSSGARALLPPELTRYVDFHVSPMIGEIYQGVDALRYRDIPGDGYDFIFVDGPPAIFGRAQFPTLDALFHLKSDGAKGSTIVVDRRVQTLSYYRLWLKQPVYYDPCLGIGVITNVYTSDIRHRAQSYGHRRLIIGNALKILDI